jgi:hypothetical protein
MCVSVFGCVVDSSVCDFLQQQYGWCAHLKVLVHVTCTQQDTAGTTTLGQKQLTLGICASKSRQTLTWVEYSLHHTYMLVMCAVTAHAEVTCTKSNRSACNLHGAEPREASSILHRIVLHHNCVLAAHRTML